MRTRAVLPLIVLSLHVLLDGHAAGRAVHGQEPGPGFERLDRNGDGKLSIDEVPRKDLLKQYDRDGDGLVTPGEIAETRRDQARRQRKASLETAGIVAHYEIRYAQTEGVEAARQSLDVYTHPDLKDAAAIVFFHGGAWQRGDKLAAHRKPARFVPEGYLFVSANYRFRPQATLDEMMSDCASAVKWVVDGAAKYGGDGRRVFVFGHSAGAHLAALLGTDHRYLKAAGLEPKVIRGVVPLDMGFYDVAAAAGSAWSPARAEMIDTVFGKDREQWRRVSPLAYVEPGAAIPPFLVVMQDGRGDAARQAVPFVEALRKAGFPAELYEAKGRDHGTLNRLLGTPGDAATDKILEFLKAHR